MSAITVLMATVALAGNGATVETKDSDLKNSVSWVLQIRQVPREDVSGVREALMKEAASNKAIRNGILFAGGTCSMMRAKDPYGDFASFMERNVLSWEWLSALGRLYIGDGVLPGVRYLVGDSPKAESIAHATRRYLASFPVRHLEETYSGFRQIGLRPDDAWKRVDDRSPASPTKDGIDEIREQLEAMGRWSLTGYTPADAERDTPAFLEAWYAYRHRLAHDTKAVVPAAWPTMFIGNKIESAIRQDMAHMMRPVDKAIESTEQRLAASRRPQPHATPAVPSKDPASLS